MKKNAVQDDRKKYKPKQKRYSKAEEGDRQRAIIG